MTDSYPKQTIDEIQIWLKSDVTQTYLQCLEWYSQQLSEVRQKALFKSDTHDKTIENLYRNLGADEALGFLADPIQLMSNYEVIRRSIDEE